MPMFRKKPVVIEAVRLTFAEWDGSGWDSDPFSEEPAWLADAALTLCVKDGKYLGYEINTPEGTMLASPGDWIIKGVKNELYPCKDEIFQATYDAI